jgi:hypothetical protein
MFGRHTHHETPRRRGGLFHRRDRDRVAGGYSESPINVALSINTDLVLLIILYYLKEAALSNPNTTRDGRKHAKQELRMMVNESHQCYARGS